MPRPSTPPQPGRRRFLRSALLTGAAVALPVRPARADLDMQCADADAQLTALDSQVEADIQAHCGMANRLDCSSLVPTGQVDVYLAQLAAIEAPITAAFCDPSVSESELIARAGLDVDFPSLVSYFDAEGLSFKAELCGSRVVPGIGPGGLWVLAALVAASGVWVLRRRGALTGSALGVAAAGTLLNPGRANATDGEKDRAALMLELVDLLETALQEVVPKGTNVRCPARILAILIDRIVPVDLALEFAEQLNAVRTDPGVQGALTAILGALNTVVQALISFEVGEMKMRIKDVTKELADLIVELDRFPAAKSAARRLAKALGKRMAKCLGAIFLVADLAYTLIDKWDVIRADC